MYINSKYIYIIVFFIVYKFFVNIYLRCLFLVFYERGIIMRKDIVNMRKIFFYYEIIFV